MRFTTLFLVVMFLALADLGLTYKVRIFRFPFRYSLKRFSKFLTTVQTPPPICYNAGDFGDVNQAAAAARNLAGRPGRAGAGPRGCIRLECIGSTEVLLCNDVRLLHLPATGLEANQVIEFPLH